MSRSGITIAASIVTLSVALVSLALFPAVSFARRTPRPRVAHVELGVSVWERGVGMVHTSRSLLTLSLEVRRGDAWLHVTGTRQSGSTTLSPTGPGAGSSHDAVLDERFRGRVIHEGTADVFTLSREGADAIAPREIEWRCEPASAEVRAAHRGAIRCISTATLDPLPWHNGHWSEVPIVLAYDGPHNGIEWDGENPPIISVP